jgi:hypothetical protein
MNLEKKELNAKVYSWMIPQFNILSILIIGLEFYYVLNST